jgi:hypothetical protein
MIGLYSPPIAIVFGIATIILVSWIGLVSIPIISIMAIIFIGGILLWLMRR